MRLRILALLPMLCLCGCLPFYQTWEIQNCENDKTVCDTPIYLNMDDLQRLPIPEYGDAVTLSSPGKLALIGNLLIINNLYTGYHFFDITDRQNPSRILFYPLVGATELTIGNGYLYANSFTDLYSIKLSDLLDGTYSTSSVYRKTNQFSLPSQPREWIADADFKNGVAYQSQRLIIGYEKPDGERYLYGVKQ